MSGRAPAEEGLGAARRIPFVIESIGVVALIAMGTMVFQTREAVIRLSEQVTQLQSQLADVPRLTERVTTAEAKNDEQDRRLNRLEARDEERSRPR